MSLLLSFYGDDFTGSSAVMEVLSFAGVPTMLFMQPPDAAMLARCPDLKAVGVAGVARSKSPDWMRANLPPVFEALNALGAPVSHYKVCSTFDSSPTVGSIGAAIETGRHVYGDRWIPLVVGAPAIRRYQVFGQLFAGAPDGIHRLDRHPVMSRHPVTPMDEADLGLHLSRQTNLSIGVVDFTSMKSGRAEEAIKARLAGGTAILAIDAMDDETLTEAGRLIWRDGREQVFAVGSQGVEYALVAHWRATGIVPSDHATPALTRVNQIFAVSGSCAPTTADQISHAQAKGFQIVDFDAATAVDSRTLAAEFERVKTVCLKHLSDGYDVLSTTSRGPADPSAQRMAEAISAAGVPVSDANDRLGAALGHLVADIRSTTGLGRVAIGGGDTSGHALTALKAEALSAVAPLAPGAPLCRLHAARTPKIDGLEVTLKGGQMGSPEFFVEAKGGVG